MDLGHLYLFIILSSSRKNLRQLPFFRASLVARRIKHLPAMQETRVRSLDWEDPLEEGMATHSSMLAWTEDPGGLLSMGLQTVGHD